MPRRTWDDETRALALRVIYVLLSNGKWLREGDVLRRIGARRTKGSLRQFAPAFAFLRSKRLVRYHSIYTGERIYKLADRTSAVFFGTGSQVVGIGEDVRRDQRPTAWEILLRDDG